MECVLHVRAPAHSVLARPPAQPVKPTSPCQAEHVYVSEFSHRLELAHSALLEPTSILQLKLAPLVAH